MHIALSRQDDAPASSVPDDNHAQGEAVDDR